MEEKKYLKWFNKLGYGMGGGSIAATSCIVNNFALLIMTDFVGLNAGIIGTIIMVSKLLDGVSDVVFGNFLDRTRTPWGKARPWMFGAGFGVAVCAVLTFVMPAGLTEFMQYAWFTVFYISYNAIFYTAMGISYNSLTALVTKNPTERVQLGMSSSFIMLAFMMTLSTAAVPLAGVIGWDKVAVIAAAIGLACNLIAFFSVRELPEEADKGIDTQTKSDGGMQVGFVKSLRLLLRNRFYISMLLINILSNFCSNLGSIATYYFTYVMRNANLYSVVNLAGFLTSIAGMFLAPVLIRKWGLYKGNLRSFTLGCVLRIFVIPCGLSGNFPLLVVFTVLSTLFTSPISPTFNAMTADIAEYTYKKDNVHIEGAMYSCVSMGSKVGSALGSGLCGWGLSWSGYVNGAQVQSPTALGAMSFMYLILPVIASFVIDICLSKMNVQGAIQKLEEVK